jgi:hypothetical protein
MMRAAELAELFKSSPEYADWFRRWWDEDFSDGGAGSDGNPLPQIFALGSQRVGGRNWTVGLSIRRSTRATPIFGTLATGRWLCRARSCHQSNRTR